jgi:NAD(P)-dependent dehydrogenase (short-subunit alcohol dehydrogenase family)
VQIAGCAVIVTGAASGLGKATAETLAAAGAHVFGFDQTPAASTSDITQLTVDVTDGEQVRQAIEQAAGSGRPLRVAVNCAGVAPAMRILSSKGVHDLELFARVIRINLVGTFAVMARAAEHIAQTEPDAHGQRGVIVNTASVAAFEGQVGQAAYTASKGGVAALTIQAARDLASVGIRVCSIAPGIMDTPMAAGVPDELREALARAVVFPHRFGRAEEFAHLVMSIVSNDYLNGETIRMDGAIRLGPR